jgi:hypothetical protein
MSWVIVIAFIALFTVSGCGSKQKPAPAKMPQVSKEPSAAADTADIFKEFYAEDSSKKKAGGKANKAAKQATFSTSASSSSFQPAFSAQGRYTVQITCVRSKSFADGMTGKMKDKGYPAYVAEVENPTPNLSGTFYRVRIGGFDGISAAKSFCENILTPSGYQYWIDKKSNDNVGMEGYGLGSGSAGSNAAASYQNVPTGSTSSPAAPQSSFESANSTYSPPPPSSSSDANAAAPSSSLSSPYQQPAAATSPASSTVKSGEASSSSSKSPASSSTSSTSPSAQPSSPAAASPATSTSGSSTGPAAATGKTNAGSSSESGWGTDSSSKSGW